MGCADRVLHFKLRDCGLTETFIASQVESTCAEGGSYGYLIASHPSRTTGLVPLFNDIRGYFSLLFGKLGRPRLIHAHFGSNAILALPLVWWLRVPLIISFYGHDYSSFPRRFMGFGACLIRLVSAIASQNLVLTQYMQDSLENLGVDRNKIRIFHPGIEIGDWRPKQRPEGRPIRILMASSLRPKKNHGAVLKALRSVDSHLYEFRIAGSGPLQNELKESAEGWGIPAEFVGSFQTVAEREEHFSWADVLLHPSKRARDHDEEGLPFLILEALAYGLPVVTIADAGIERELLQSVIYCDQDLSDFPGLLSQPERIFDKNRITLGRQLVAEKYSHSDCMQTLFRLYNI